MTDRVTNLTGVGQELAAAAEAAEAVAGAEASARSVPDLFLLADRLA